MFVSSCPVMVKPLKEESAARRGFSSMEELRLPELQARFHDLVGQATRSPDEESSAAADRGGRHSLRDRQSPEHPVATD
ncbi:MAG: hypothetical protein IPK13_00270 [Deltaproteobacteria bacterium]|nr:hypothetical protein [Deltaproteobacteria bacterium]